MAHDDDVPAALDLGSLRPGEDTVARYRDAGYWRDQTPLDDLGHWARATPRAVALVGHRPGGQVDTLTYAELAEAVERYAAALSGLGVGAGSVVSTWFPTRWQLAALLLACWRVGAAVSSMMPTFGSREVERMMARVGSSVCVTVDAESDGAGGVDRAAAVATMAPRLPALRHQVVLGTPGPGQLGFTDVFETARPAPPTGVPDADAPSLVLFTSGTTGSPKAVVHSLNTITAGMVGYREVFEPGPEMVLFTPHTLSHGAALAMLLSTVHDGATLVLMEQWDPAAALALVEAQGVTTATAAPIFLQGLLDAAGDAARPARLVDLAVAAAAPSSGLVAQVWRRWGVPLRSVWAMTEVIGIFTRPDDPHDWAAHSVGRPTAGLEVDLRGYGPEPVTAEAPGRLRVRGPGVCLATAVRDGGEPRVVAEEDDGWYDTGDLAAPDGRGGYRIVGRAADRVGGAFMIPVGDVEDALREHPAVADAAVIETYSGDEPVPCAVVVPGADAPTLDELRAFLLDQGMTEWWVPRRLEVVDAFPRNGMGKVEKAALRRRYATAG